MSRVILIVPEGLWGLVSNIILVTWNMSYVWSPRLRGLGLLPDN